MMLRAALFTIVKMWKQPKAPSADEWIIWSLHTMECHSVLQRQELVPRVPASSCTEWVFFPLGVSHLGHVSCVSTPTPTPPLTPAKSFELLCSVALSGPSSLGSQKGQKRRVGSGVRGDGVWDKPAQEGTKEAVDTPLPLLCTRDNP